MAYVSQERKAKLAPKIKAVLKKYGVKGSLSIHNHSTLMLKIKSGKIDFVENFIATNTTKLYGVPMEPERVKYIREKRAIDVNPYWYREHFSGRALKFLEELMPAMNDGNHDNSDIRTDYFDVGWYVDVNIGAWNRPYILE